ncbi:hypothetical protein ACOME3_003066 [Neoechinorhynchus agilis]
MVYSMTKIVAEHPDECTMNTFAVQKGFNFRYETSDEFGLMKLHIFPYSNQINAYFPKYVSGENCESELKPVFNKLISWGCKELKLIKAHVVDRLASGCCAFQMDLEKVHDLINSKMKGLLHSVYELEFEGANCCYIQKVKNVDSTSSIKNEDFNWPVLPPNLKVRVYKTGSFVINGCNTPSQLERCVEILESVIYSCRMDALNSHDKSFGNVFIVRTIERFSQEWNDPELLCSRGKRCNASRCLLPSTSQILSKSKKET